MSLEDLTFHFSLLDAMRPTLARALLHLAHSNVANRPFRMALGTTHSYSSFLIEYHCAYQHFRPSGSVRRSRRRRLSIASGQKLVMSMALKFNVCGCRCREEGRDDEFKNTGIREKPHKHAHTHTHGLVGALSLPAHCRIIKDRDNHLSGGDSWLALLALALALSLSFSPFPYLCVHFFLSVLMFLLSLLTLFFAYTHKRSHRSQLRPM